MGREEDEVGRTEDLVTVPLRNLLTQTEAFGGTAFVVADSDREHGGEVDEDATTVSFVGLTGRE